VTVQGFSAPQELAVRYRDQLLANGRGHYIAAQAAIWKHRVIGSLSAVLSAAAGSTLLSTGGDSPTVIVLLAGGIGLFVSALAGLQTFLGYAEVASQHLIAGRRFAELRRDFDILLLKLDRLGEYQARVDQLDEVKKRWDQTAMESPLIPPWADRKARRVLEHQARVTGSVKRSEPLVAGDQGSNPDNYSPDARPGG
jgi:hypothetical protein